MNDAVYNIKKTSFFFRLGFVCLQAASFYSCGEKKNQDGSSGWVPANKILKMVKFDPKVLERLGVKVDVAGSSAQGYEFTVPGILDYDQEHYAEIGSIADGRVSQVFVRVGDKVKKGQILATMMVPEIAVAQAEFVAREAASKVAKEHAAREATLLNRELTTAREAELAKGDEVKTAADLAAASAKLTALGATRPEGRDIAKAGSLSLTSPLDGVLVRRDAVLGRFIQAKETAFVVADPSILRAEINVFESDLPYFKVGSEVKITIDAHPGKIVQAKVALIEPHVGKASRTLRGQIFVPNPDLSLRAGEFVRASIKLPESNDHRFLYLPAGAVQPLGEDDVVFVEKAAGEFEVRPVVVGRRTAQIVEIEEGLSKGERIVVEGTFLLRGEVSKQ